MAVKYRNPVIAGFYPDPSICRCGEDFFLVTSTFEYFPGVPIFHSRDLIHWQSIGHVLTRASQLPLERAKSSQGIYAPTIRRHAGRFYVVTTNVGGGGNFLVSASNPAGPWSEPTWIREAEFGIDPSLFFDEGGKVYYTRQGGGERGAIYQAEIDLASGTLVTETRRIWAGTGGAWPEGPHLYKVGGVYYLLISEGGTGYEHSLTVARSSSPWGPFEADPANPILTHRNRKGHPIQATGHGDLLQLANGSWWIVLLGIRPWNASRHHLGRETFLAPVRWSDAGWPVIHGGTGIELEMQGDGLPDPHPWPVASVRDDFNTTELRLDYVLLRNPDPELVSLTARPGYLRVYGSRATLGDLGSPSFVALRQRQYRAAISARLEFAAADSREEAGLGVRMNEDNHYTLAVGRDSKGPRVRLKARIGAEVELLADEELTPGPILLSIDAHPDRYEFFYQASAVDRRSLGTAPTAPLASEVATGFTGVTLGMYATAGRDARMPPADFDWFEVRPLE